MRQREAAETERGRREDEREPVVASAARRSHRAGGHGHRLAAVHVDDVHRARDALR